MNEEIFIEELESTYHMTCVSMGNPHAVVFMNDVENLEIEKIGPYFENHKRFPNRTNTEFVKVLDRNNVQMRVWERGSGETLACGTGCGSTAATLWTEGKLPGGVLTCQNKGGTLKVTVSGENGTITSLLLEGPADVLATYTI